MPPVLGGGHMICGVTAISLPRRGCRKFEAGTFPIVPAIGLGAAVDYLAAVGLETVQKHEQALIRRLHAILAPIAGLRILGPAAADKAGITSFTIAGQIPEEVARGLADDGIALCRLSVRHSVARALHLEGSLRASVYFYNTMAEIELLGDRLRNLLPRLSSVRRRPRRRCGCR